MTIEESARFLISYHLKNGGIDDLHTRIGNFYMKACSECAGKVILTDRNISITKSFICEPCKMRRQEAGRAIYENLKRIGKERGWDKYGIKSGKICGRERTRMLVRLRDKFTCVECGKVRLPKDVEKHNLKIKGLKGRIKLFDVHHINGECGKNSKGYDSTKDISGMITLCHKCHYNRHDFSP